MNKLLVIENDRINNDCVILHKGINRIPSGRYYGTKAFLIKAFLKSEDVTTYNVKKSEIFKDTVDFSTSSNLYQFYRKLSFHCDGYSNPSYKRIIVDSMFNVMRVHKDNEGYYYETHSILGNPKEGTSKTEIIKDMKAEIEFDCERQLLNLLSEIENKPELFRSEYDNSILAVMTEDEANWFQGKTPEAGYVRSLFKCASKNINQPILIMVKYGGKAY